MPVPNKKFLCVYSIRQQVLLHNIGTKHGKTISVPFFKFLLISNFYAKFIDTDIKLSYSPVIASSWWHH